MGLGGSAVLQFKLKPCGSAGVCRHQLGGVVCWCWKCFRFVCFELLWGIIFEWCLVCFFVPSSGFGGFLY